MTTTHTTTPEELIGYELNNTIVSSSLEPKRLMLNTRISSSGKPISNYIVQNKTMNICETDNLVVAIDAYNKITNY